MFTTSQQEFKQVAAALRKGIQDMLPEQTLSHSQCLELLAKAMGKSSYAELLPTLPVSAPTSRTANKPPRFPLRNENGALDLVEPGQEGAVVCGRTFKPVEGTVEDIRYCVSYAKTAVRGKGSRLDAVYDGETEVNWNGAVTRRDEQGHAQWRFDDSSSKSEVECLLVPKGFNPWGSKEDLASVPCRELLLEAYAELAHKRGCAQRLLNEVVELGAASALLDSLADTIGFSLHHGELSVLETRLASAA